MRFSPVSLQSNSRFEKLGRAPNPRRESFSRDLFHGVDAVAEAQTHNLNDLIVDGVVRALGKGLGGPAGRAAGPACWRGF